jgi:hypothetical protein
VDKGQYDEVIRLGLLKSPEPGENVVCLHVNAPTDASGETITGSYLLIGDAAGFALLRLIRTKEGDYDVQPITSTLPGNAETLAQALLPST